MIARKLSSLPIGAAWLRLLAIALLVAAPLAKSSSFEAQAHGADLTVLHAAVSDLQRPSDPLPATPPLPQEPHSVAPEQSARLISVMPAPPLGVLLWREAAHHARAPPASL